MGAVLAKFRPKPEGLPGYIALPELGIRSSIRGEYQRARMPLRGGAGGFFGAGSIHCAWKVSRVRRNPFQLCDFHVTFPWIDSSVERRSFQFSTNVRDRSPNRESVEIFNSKRYCSLAPIAAVHSPLSLSTGKRPNCGIDTAGIDLAKPCCWLGGWQRRMSR